MPDDVGVTDSALVELVARKMMETWAARMAKGRRWDRLDAGDRQRWHQDARDAIAAMQPALDAAREAGVQKGLEQAAAMLDHKAENRSPNDAPNASVLIALAYRWGADSIRALIPAAPAPMEDADAR